MTLNLLHEPWIVVLDHDGREHEVSILEVFDQAPRLAAISGEVPTQVFAITRLLLAFLHRALDGPTDQDKWFALWGASTLPMERIRAYAELVHDRFNLFDDRAPFYQVAGLRSLSGEATHLRKLVADIPDPGKTDMPLFTNRSVRNLDTLTAAEAARWLVHAHAFDTAGTKTGAVGDPAVRRGKGYGASLGWCGQLGPIMVHGNTLRETLVLNLIARDVESYVRIGGVADVPPWERDPDGPAANVRAPRGAIDLYTWQTRRIRLVGDRGAVTGAVLGNGDPITSANLFGVEPHSAWRYDTQRSKTQRSVVYRPRSHDPNRSVWRGLAALLPSVSGRRIGKGDQPQPYLTPGVLQWISDLTANGYLPDNYHPGIWVCGIDYGAKSATIAEVIDDVLPLSVLLLREDHPVAGRIAVSAADDADKIAWHTRCLATNIAQAAGADAKLASTAGDAACELLHAALDEPYRRWIASLEPGIDLDAARREWRQTATREARRIAAQVISEAPPAAWMGRQIGNEDRTRLVNLPLAEVWFKSALRRMTTGTDDTREVAV